MLSRRCIERNDGLIPKLLSDHGALLYGDSTVVDLSTAENWLLMDGVNSELTQTTWSDCDLGYSDGVGGSPKIRHLIASLVNDFFNPYHKIGKEHVVLGAGGCFALDALVEQICDPGDGILIASPYWPGLDLSIAVRQGAVPLPVHVPLESFFQIASLEHYDRALAAATVPVKAIVICNPHNPLGRNYPRETLDAMLAFCAHNHLHLISDEVYALSQHANINEVSSGNGFVSALSLDTTRQGKGLVHVVYSLSKDFGCNGIRMGAFISPENRKICLSGALSTNCQLSTMANLITEKIILSAKNVDYVNTRGRELLKTAYQSMEEFLRRKEVEFISAECGLYVFAKLCPVATLEAENEFRGILKKHGVIISAGTDYHFQQSGWFRICYACKPSTLKEGLVRISRCIDEFRQLLI